MSDRINYSGYVINRLLDDFGKSQYVQRGHLMLLAFCNDSYFDGAEADHINRNTTDNRIENLRWVSHQVNCMNRRYTKHEKDRALYLIYDDGTVQFFESRKETGLPSPTLSRILSGSHSQKYKCRGFYFDKLHEQTDKVKQLVRLYMIDSLLSNICFKDKTGKVHYLFPDK